MRDKIPGDISLEENQISAYYQKGLFYSAEATILSFRPSKKKDERVYEVTEIIDYQKLARDHLLLALSQTGTCEEQRIKIKVALLLVNLSPLPSEEANEYFYLAVEIAIRYIGEDFYGTAEGESIVKYYLNSINPNFKKLFIDPNISSFLPLLRLMIQGESERRKSEKKISAQKSREASKHISSLDEILLALAVSVGPFRLHILSEQSDTCIANHHMTGHPVALGKTLTFRIFDRPRKYRICIDRGSSEIENQFSEKEFREFIYPFLKRYISMKEYIFFDTMLDNMASIDEAELRMKLPRSTQDYRSFFARVIAESGVTSQLHDSAESIESLSQAIDICRTITLASLQGEAFAGGDLLQEIDRILTGKIHRKVLHLVTSLLLSRNESIDGTGYPYGLVKKNIPLECRIYPIIRAYEALLMTYPGNHKTVLSKMSEWAEMGYFDPDILKIFLVIFDDAPVPQMEENTTKIQHVSTHHRTMKYELYVSKWQKIIDMMRSIEDGYGAVRQTEESEVLDIAQKKIKRNKLFLMIKKLQGSLREESGIRKVIYLTRHGATISDAPGGPPGSDDEILTQDGENSSLEKGKLFDGLDIQLRSSPLPRAVQSAEIICHQVRGCIEKCLDCPHISREKVLTNPPKDEDTERYGSLALKIMTDTGGLPEYLVSYSSSSDESMIVVVSHRDILVQLRFWIENLFREASIHGKKYPFGNDEVIEIHTQGGQVISEEGQKSRGILFSLRAWKTSLAAVREMTESIFGEAFIFEREGGVNLIEIHRAFLDFLDFHMEHTPDKMSLFFQMLGTNLSTQHFGEILQSEGFLGESPKEEP